MQILLLLKFFIMFLIIRILQYKYFIGKKQKINISSNEKSNISWFMFQHKMFSEVCFLVTSVTTHCTSKRSFTSMCHNMSFQVCWSWIWIWTIWTAVLLIMFFIWVIFLPKMLNSCKNLNYALKWDTSKTSKYYLNM